MFRSQDFKTPQRRTDAKKDPEKRTDPFWPKCQNPQICISIFFSVNGHALLVFYRRKYKIERWRRKHDLTKMADSKLQNCDKFE